QLPTPRAYAAAAVVAGHVFVIGGADQTGPLSDTTIYIPEADAAGDTPWDTATALPMPGAYLNAATVADTILVVGGAPDGAAVAYALWKLQDRGRMFVNPGEKLYEGMIIGIHSRDNDLVVNPIKG
ncbi:MAG TPA: hypothetical protein PK954_15735, partial [Anaerolineales bacterium]|nr:hypothetical protein [Anaerolineales bacterium]